MFWLKACPKCQGDLYEGTDIYGTYVCCLQCARCLTDVEENQLTIDTPTDVIPARRRLHRRQAA